MHLTKQTFIKEFPFPLICMLISVLCLDACAVANVYSIRGMEGRVVDKATKQPLQSVVVIEVWDIGGGFEGHTIDYMPLRETETDKSGNYSFPPRGTMHIKQGFLKEDAPYLIYFAPGYKTIGKLNRYHPDRRFEFVRQSDWHEKTIELEKLDGSAEMQAKELEKFDNAISNLAGAGRRCLWMGIPRTLKLIRQEDIRLTKLGADPKVAISAPWRLDELKKCPSFEKFQKVFGNEVP